MRIAVIGAGLAGLTAARDLHEDGHTVVVWEKSRGPGGRTSTRRGPDGLRFDHGAPFLHDGDLPLDDAAATTRHRLSLPGGAVREEVIGIPSANAPAKLLAEELDVRVSQRVETILRSGERGYHLAAEDGGAMGVFDAVIVTAPAPQAAHLLQHVAPSLADRARGVDYAPCWSVMVAWEEPLHLGFTAATDAPGIALAVAEHAKPGRSSARRARPRCWRPSRRRSSRSRWSAGTTGSGGSPPTRCTPPRTAGATPGRGCHCPRPASHRTRSSRPATGAAARARAPRCAAGGPPRRRCSPAWRERPGRSAILFDDVRRCRLRRARRPVRPRGLLPGAPTRARAARRP